MKTDPWLTDRLRGDAVLVKAERKIEAAVLAAMTQWMSAAKAAMFGQPITLTADAQFTVDVDAAQASFAVWTQGIAEHIEPAITEAFGASFAGAMRTADVSVLPYQEAHMQDVFDRLKIWPEGAFEDMRPELVQAVSRASTIAEAQDQVAGILDINAPTRRLRQQITDVDAELAALDVGDSREGALRATRRRLWEEHDRSLGEWQYLARRIARTEVQGAVEGGALASAQATAAATGERMYKQWLATHDSRCRKTHQVADGQIVGIEGKFTVGRSTLEHPADPRGQDKETINCRCTLLILDEAEVQEKLRGKWGGRGVQPMSHRMGPDDPAEIDNAVELATREAKGEVVDWPKRNDPPDYPNPAVPDPTPPTPPTPAQTLAESVDDDLPIAEVLSENAAPAARRRSEFSGLSLDQLTEEMTASIDVEDFDRMDRFAAEIDRREAANLRAREKRERNRSAKERAQSAKYDELLAAGVDDETAIEQAFGIGVVQQRRMNAISTLRGWGYQGRSLDDLFKAWHRDEAHDEYLRAEEATRTHMLKSRYEGKMDARSLWFRNEATARKYASDELLEWWDQNGRATVEELKARLMDPTELARIQASRSDFLQ